MSSTNTNPRIQANLNIIYPIWIEHEKELNRLKAKYPDITFNGGVHLKDGPRSKAHTERDEWGCLWHYPGRGMAGQAVEFPLEDWNSLETWNHPTPEDARKKAMNEIEKQDNSAETIFCWLEHGFLFLRLTYLRGFNNFMIDVAEDNPMIYKLRDIVVDYWYEYVKTRVENGTNHVRGGDDLGLQKSLPISPDAWRRLIKPGFMKIFEPAREKGLEIYLHTDGYILDIIPDIIDTGVTTLNPQDLVNGLDNLRKIAKGRVNINLDIDRQKITVFGTPSEIDTHIRECIETLGSAEGGLSLQYGVYEGTPIENITAVVEAIEKYRDMWA